MMDDIGKVRAFYEDGGEVGRLERGLGKVEAYRTKELLLRFLQPGMAICDIGGGCGYYADWLASLGHPVTMIELSAKAVAYASAHQSAPYTALAGDARHLPLQSLVADAVLLMGPLYHLQEKEGRMRALAEAARILRPDGLLFAAGISKFSSATWALSVYGLKNDYIDDPVYMGMLWEELHTGIHNKPDTYNCLCDAFFHTPEGFREEIVEAGFQVDSLYAVEGCVWLAPALEEKWEEPACQERLLKLVRMTEQEPSLLGLSPHFLAVAHKPCNK